jgi:hypothetical protein
MAIAARIVSDELEVGAAIAINAQCIMTVSREASI